MQSLPILAKVDFYPEPGLPGAREGSRRQAESNGEEPPNQFHRTGRERFRQSRDGAGTRAGERSRVRGGVQVREDVRFARVPAGTRQRTVERERERPSLRTELRRRSERIAHRFT